MHADRGLHPGGDRPFVISRSHIFTLLLVLQHTIRLARLGPVTLKMRISAIRNPATACVVRNDRLIHREKPSCQRKTRRKHEAVWGPRGGRKGV